MSRRQQTIATFAVSITIPNGFTVADAQQFIQSAIENSGGKSPESPDRIIGMTCHIQLTKKVTVYGNN